MYRNTKPSQRPWSGGRGRGCKKAKSEEALQIAEERREMKIKRQRERSNQLKAEIQRTVRKDKKLFFNEQRKEVDGKNRM